MIFWASLSFGSPIGCLVMGVLIRRQNISCQACHPISAQIRRSNRDSRQGRPVPYGLRTDAMNTDGNSSCHTSSAIISTETQSAAEAKSAGRENLKSRRPRLAVTCSTYSACDKICVYECSPVDREKKKMDWIDYLYNESAWEPRCHLQAASLGQAQQPHVHIIVYSPIIPWHLYALRLMMDKILEPWARLEVPTESCSN